MIARITGVLLAVEEGVGLVEPEGGLVYEVLLPAYAAARLGASIDSAVTLYTHHFLEGQLQASAVVPRLAGFPTPRDRRFFELFTSCKGVGRRKALRAMSLSTAQIAAAIADRDLATLQSLPEIGKRSAETIVATLHGKVDPFLDARPAGAGAPGEPDARPLSDLEREAIDVLVQLGEPRAAVRRWLDAAIASGQPADLQDLIQRVYHAKSGA